MAAVTADPSRELKLYFRINRDGNITLTFIDANGAPFSLLNYTPVVNFKNRSNDATNFLQLTSGSGLTQGSSSIIITLTKAQAAKFREQAYFWELVMTKNSLESDWLTGEALFHTGKFDGLVASSTVTVTNSGTPVTITVSISGGKFNSKMTVASAALLGCGTSPVVILTAPGSGKFHAVTSIVASYKVGTVAFNFTSELVFKTVGGDVQFLLSGDLNSLTSANFDMIKQGQKQVANVAYILTTADGSNATLGNGNLTLTIYYSIEDVNI